MATELAADVSKVKGRKQTAIYVYDMPVRLWHWINALCIVVLCITGYFIGSPPPTILGEASNSFLFGYIRMTHFAAGQILAFGFLCRFVWMFFGNKYSRQLFTLPLTNIQWWKEVIFELKWYAFIERDPNKYVGHNPLAHLSMFSLFVLPMLVIIFTGCALYAEGQGIDSTWYALFGWVFTLVGDSFTVHTIHHITMWVLVVFAMIHIYAAIREDIMSRQSMVSTMISGWRMFKDDKP